MVRFSHRRVDVNGIEIDNKVRFVDLVRGAVGVVKAATGVGAASPEDYRSRWDICLACDQHDAGACRACGCFTGAKVRVASESCPVGKWVQVQAVLNEGRPCCGNRAKLDNPSADL